MPPGGNPSILMRVSAEECYAMALCLVWLWSLLLLPPLLLHFRVMLCFIHRTLWHFIGAVWTGNCSLYWRTWRSRNTTFVSVRLGLLMYFVCLLSYTASRMALRWMSLTSCWLVVSHHQGVCIMTTAFLHFFFLASFCWVLTEAWQSYMAVTGKVRTRLIRKRFLCLGWGKRAERLLSTVSHHASLLLFSHKQPYTSPIHCARPLCGAAGSLTHPALYCAAFVLESGSHRAE